MSAWMQNVESCLIELRDEIDSLSPRIGRKSLREAACRSHGLLTATRYHLGREEGPVLTVFLGGTGTGKSTLLNRLLGAEVSIVSFRRTYTNGAVAVVPPKVELPENWLGVPHTRAETLPVRGEAGALTVVSIEHPVLERTLLVDTPDLDGEREEHHAEADRAFRWANRAVFLVTPEKYQMTELPPYYRLATRYGLPALFLMNKCEEREAVEDYKARLAEWGWPDAKVFAVARDDSPFQPDPDAGLQDFRKALAATPETSTPSRAGLANRCRDAAGRVRDQVLLPLKEDRRAADALLAALARLSRPSPDVDVSPFTERLQARMREKSILYLIGPQRIADRMKNFYRNFFPEAKKDSTLGETGDGATTPDFWQILVDQFVTAQSQFDDLVRSNPSGSVWIDSDPETYSEIKFDPAEAGRIAEREIEALGVWLQERWDGAPRDTSAIERLLKYLPGGVRLAKWSEAAPYLLVIVCAGSKAFLGALDLLVIGGFSLATWLGEKLSNEVTARVRATNRRICQEYLELVNRQADCFKDWLSSRTPSPHEIARLEDRLDRFEEAMEESGKD
jgi:hypothetical protein